MKNDRKEHRTQTEQFRLDGYLALPGFLDEQEIAELREHVFRFIATVVPTMRGEEVYYGDKDDPTALKQLQQMFQFDSYFDYLMMDSRFTELASTLLAHDVRGINLQYFNKPPGIGRATPAHQDGHYFMIEPSEAVTMWLALEDVDEENGCIRYVRGSHLRGLRPHGRTNTLGFSQGLRDFGTDRKSVV